MAFPITVATGGPLRPSLVYFATLLAIACMPSPLESYSAHVADMCDSGAVDTAAHLVFQDGVQRYFISNGNNYWFLNVTDEIPDVESAAKIPFGFDPDVAILKNTSLCPSGHLSLLLIQMKRSADANEAEWLTLEMNIGKWSDNETGPINWGQVSRIGLCDLDAATCTTTDNYFATMSFDFKKRLSAAFGTIGETAYFIQEQSMYKVTYKTQCITNPYKEVTAYPATNIGTVTTAALSDSGNSSVVLFDNDLHVKVFNVSLDDVTFGDSLTDIASWKENANYFFEQCPLVESALGFLLMDVFSSSKKHFAKKQFIFITCSIVLLCIIVLILSLLVFGLLRRSKKGSSSQASNEANDEQLIEQRLNIEIKSSENGEQQKTLLQTSC